MTITLNGTTGITTPAETVTGTNVWSVGSTQIYKDTSGNVGIGTSTPDALLHVYQTGGKVATFGNNVNNNGTYVVLAGSSSNKNWAIANNMIAGGALEFVQTSATGGTTIGATSAMSIDSSGRVTMPYQPAFNAYCGQNTNSTTAGTIPFNNTRLNVGSYFNTSTYTFTAPVAGSYFFSATIYIQKNSTAYANLGIRKNGSTVLYTETDGTATQLCLTTSIILTLSANDTVNVGFGNNGSRQYYQGVTESSFSGYLIG